MWQILTCRYFLYLEIYMKQNLAPNVYIITRIHKYSIIIITRNTSAQSFIGRCDRTSRWGNDRMEENGERVQYYYKTLFERCVHSLCKRFSNGMMCNKRRAIQCGHYDAWYFCFQQTMFQIDFTRQSCVLRNSLLIIKHLIKQQFFVFLIYRLFIV